MATLAYLKKKQKTNTKHTFEYCTYFTIFVLLVDLIACPEKFAICAKYHVHYPQSLWATDHYFLWYLHFNSITTLFIVNNVNEREDVEKNKSRCNTSDVKNHKQSM